MKKLDSFAVEAVLKEVDEIYTGSTPEDLEDAHAGIIGLIHTYFEALKLDDETRALDQLISARESMRAIIRACIEGRRTLGYLTRPDQVELCKAFEDILQRIALTADAHFGDIH